MIIERLIEDIGKVGAKILFNKEEKSSKKINLNHVSSTDILTIILKRLIIDGKYNEAENILFEEINKNKSQEIYAIALEFYNSLLAKSDKELQAGDFTRKEIYQGLEEIKSIYGN